MIIDRHWWTAISAIVTLTISALLFGSLGAEWLSTGRPLWFILAPRALLATLLFAVTLRQWARTDWSQRRANTV